MIAYESFSTIKTIRYQYLLESMRVGEEMRIIFVALSVVDNSYKSTVVTSVFGNIEEGPFSLIGNSHFLVRRAIGNVLIFVDYNNL